MAPQGLSLILRLVLRLAAADYLPKLPYLRLRTDYSKTVVYILDSHSSRLRVM